MRLEQACQRPGLWHIEGFVVIRVHGRRKQKGWWIYEVTPTEDGGRTLRHMAPSLSEARSWVRDEVA